MKPGTVVYYGNALHSVIDPNPPTRECVGEGPHLKIVELNSKGGRTGVPFVVSASQVSVHTVLDKLTRFITGG